MVMSWFWCIAIGASLAAAMLTGQGSELAASVLLGAQNGVTLAISLAGSICLWSGVGKLMEKTGITLMLSRLFRPVLHRMFPSAKGDSILAGQLSGNICANFLGLGNAATPMGIAAVKRLKNPHEPTLATDEMCRLIVLNTASIQFLPTNVAAVRAGLGCGSAFDILPAVWLTSLCSAGSGVVLACILGRLTRNG